MPRSLIATLLVLLALLISIPYLVSTSWSQKQGIKLFNALSSQEIQVEEIKLKWLGPQRVKNLTYYDKDGEKRLSFELFETQTSLLSLLFGGRTFEKTVVKNPFFLFEPNREKKAVVQTRKMPRFTETLLIEGGTLYFPSSGEVPITISEVEVEKEGELYTIVAKTAQGETLGKIEATLSLEDVLELKGKVENFPLSTLDQIAETSLYTDALGKTLSSEFTLMQEPQKALQFHAKVQSDNLKGTIVGKTEEKQLVLDPSSTITYTLTPKFFTFLLPESQKGQWNLVSKSDITLQIPKGTFPLSLDKRDFDDIVLHALGVIDRAEINHKELGSYSLNNFTLDVVSLHNLEINYKGEIVGKQTSQLEGSFSITPTGDVLFTCNYRSFPVSLLSLLSPELEKSIHRLFENSFDLNAEGIYRKRGVESTVQLTAPALQINGKIKGKLPTLDFEVAGEKTLTGKEAELIGQSVTYQLAGQLHLSREALSIPYFNGEISNPYLAATLTGREVLNFDEIEVIAKGEILQLPMNEEFPEVKLDRGTFLLQIDGKENLIKGRASAKTRLDTEKYTLEARFKVKDFVDKGQLNFKGADYTFKCAFDGFPLAILNPFMPEGIDLPLLFGTTATINAKGSYGQEEGTLDIDAKGEGFITSATLSIDSTLTVSQSKPAFVHWELTPARFEGILTAIRPEHEATFQLSRPASVDLTIKELTCPSTPPTDVSQFLCQSGFVGDLTVGTLYFRSQDWQDYLVIDDISGSIEGTDFTEAIEIDFHGRNLAQNIPVSERSGFEFKGKMLNFWTKEGKFNREGLTLDGELSLELVPVRQLTEIIPLDDESRQIAQAVLGELVNARIYGEISQLSGPLTVDVKASNFKATLPIMLHPHAIHLRDTVDAELTLTEEVNRTLLVDINPLLITGAYSDHPIKVYIDPQGFEIPLGPYHLQGVKIGSAKVDLGKIRVKNGGQIQLLMNFLKAKDVTPEGEMEAWFTPIYFSLDNGVASYSRFDAQLAGNVHLAMWGSINLITNHVNMVLGISPATLQKHFGIEGLGSKNMFQVKMRGTTDNLEMDWSSATTRIGILVARVAGGQLGNIVGGIVEQVVTAFGDEKTPPPTTSPFPWASEP